MKKLLVMLALLSGCTYTPEFTYIMGPRRTTNGGVEPALTMMVGQRFGGHKYCGYIHSSEPQNGAPFNKDFEITMDHVGCGHRFGGNYVKKD